MSTKLYPAIFVSKNPQTQPSLRQLGGRALRAAAGFWWVVVVLGQLIFAFTDHQSLQLNPANANAVRMLEKLNAR